MKRILTFAAAGLFVTGLALLPLSARADQTVTGGKTTTSAQSGGTMVPAKDSATSAVQPSTSAVKKDDKTTTAAPAGTAPATGGAVVKSPAKGPS